MAETEKLFSKMKMLNRVKLENFNFLHIRTRSTQHILLEFKFDFRHELARVKLIFMSRQRFFFAVASA